MSDQAPDQIDAPETGSRERLASNAFVLYVHIPFCFHKCPYCDFNTYAVSSLPETEYVNALLSELDYRASRPEWAGRVLRSIFFGGGTPSIFSPFSIRKIIGAICQRFQLADDAEITLEANPTPFSFEQAKGFKEAGVNRLSLGAQSLNDQTLRALGRAHSAADVYSAVQAVREAGIARLNLDLIFGAPEQSLESLVTDLRSYVALAPDHISPYGLTIEKGTPFYSSAKKGLLKLPPEPSVVSMLERIEGELGEANYERYEISNYAKFGMEARHNLAYWNGDDYLGLGAGAHSYNKQLQAELRGKRSFGRRWCNFALPAKYIAQTAAQGEAESWHEVLRAKDAVFEFFFLGLRKIQGVELSHFRRLFGLDARQVYPSTLEVLCERNLLEQHGDRLFLSERGLMLADSVLENFAHPEGKLPEAWQTQFSAIAPQTMLDSQSKQKIAANESERLI
jgi:oxygen-independent coproporphyrinogen-3 oxidase